MKILIKYSLAIIILFAGRSIYAQVQDELQNAIDNIQLPTEVKGNLHLPTATSDGITFTWTSSHEAIISVTEGTGYGDVAPAPIGQVNRPSADTEVALMVKATKNGFSQNETFLLNVKAQPETPEYVAYLYMYFSGDLGRTDDQQIYFAVSQDGLSWSDLNENNPILVSELGDGGVRDPYLIRSPEGDHFYLIATDLDIRHPKYNGNWGIMATQGSNSIMVWESADLVNWSEQRMIDVSSAIDAGNTWAPECIWDETTGEYLVYWSSVVATNNFNGHQIFLSKTRDFKHFSDAKVYVDPPHSVIDASMYKQGDTYYRLIKNEESVSVYFEKAKSLLDYSNNTALGNSFEHIPNAELESFTGGYEGATMFKFLEEEKWCALVDEYTGPSRGYIPFITNDLDKPNSLKLLPNGEYIMPSWAKHGTVLPITQKEYDALVEKWAVKAPAEELSKNAILNYTFDESLTGNIVFDQTGNGNNAQLFGNATYVNDSEKGQVLHLDGSANTYLEFPKGFFDGRKEMTIWMDIKPATNPTFHFTMAIGQNNAKYMFLRTRNEEIRNAITSQSNSGERDVSLNGSFNNKWSNVAIVMNDHQMKLFVDSALVDSHDYVRSIPDLGSELLAYLGKSFYNDPYFTGSFDNVQVYNRALSEEEISTGILEDIIKEDTADADTLNNEIILDLGMNEDDASIYPNPTTGQVTIACKTAVKKVMLFDLGGQQLKSLVSGTSSPTIEMDLSTLKAGSYFVKIQHTNGTVFKRAYKE